MAKRRRVFILGEAVASDDVHGIMRYLEHHDCHPLELVHEVVRACFMKPTLFGQLYANQGEKDLDIVGLLQPEPSEFTMECVQQVLMNTPDEDDRDRILIQLLERAMEPVWSDITCTFLTAWADDAWKERCMPMFMNYCDLCIFYPVVTCLKGKNMTLFDIRAALCDEPCRDLKLNLASLCFTDLLNPDLKRAIVSYLIFE